jgi:hypothetical protein
MIALPLVFSIMACFFVYIIVHQDDDEKKRGLKNRPYYGSAKLAPETSDEPKTGSMITYFNSLTNEQLLAIKKRLERYPVTHNDGFADNIRQIYILRIETILIERDVKEILKEAGKELC